MTPLLDLDDALRRALHAAADPLIPAGDGLAVIRHRTSDPSVRDRFTRALSFILPAHRTAPAKENTTHV